MSEDSAVNRAVGFCSDNKTLTSSYLSQEGKGNERKYSVCFIYSFNPQMRGRSLKQTNTDLMSP